MRLINFCLLLILCGLSACQHSQTNYLDSWDMTDERRDSLRFAEEHHYSQNYNFEVTADSLVLLRNVPEDDYTLESGDSLAVYHHDRLVVADIRMMPKDSLDSVWVKVARDQETMGWTHEKDLLKSVVPNDSISKSIRLFSNSHLIAFFYIVGCFAVFILIRIMRHKRSHMIHVNDINSVYPTFLCITVALSATLYAVIQQFHPELWRQYYFHPSLNPFAQVPLLGLFLSSIWLIAIFAIAAVDDVRRHLKWGEALTYLLGVACLCFVLYVVLTLTIPIYIGWLILFIYVIYAITNYLHYYAARYFCGKCGAALSRKGRCPHCGTINE